MAAICFSKPNVMLIQQSPNKYFLSTDYVPDVVPGMGCSRGGWQAPPPTPLPRSAEHRGSGLWSVSQEMSA